MTNLTTLANVKSWVNSTQSTDDAMLARLITVASQQILQELQRPDLGMTTITELQNGRGTTRIQLRNWPIIAANSLTINGITVPLSTSANNYGYWLEPVFGGTAGKPQNMGIRGWGGPGGILVSNGQAQFPYGGQAYGGDGSLPKPFTAGEGNIAVNYSYGYAIQSEAQTIPATTYQITPNAPYGMYSSNISVINANTGATMTAIASGTPSAGQYVPPNPFAASPTYVYTFAAADTGTPVLLSYNYIPSQLEQACIEVVGERYKYRGRIGLKTQSLGGQETTSYDLSGLTAAIKDMIKPYKLAWNG